MAGIQTVSCPNDFDGFPKSTVAELWCSISAVSGTRTSYVDSQQLAVRLKRFFFLKDWTWARGAFPCKTVAVLHFPLYALIRRCWIFCTAVGSRHGCTSGCSLASLMLKSRQLCNTLQFLFLGLGRVQSSADRTRGQPVAVSLWHLWFDTCDLDCSKRITL